VAAKIWLQMGTRSVLQAWSIPLGECALALQPQDRDCLHATRLGT
jgi:hypothetical protein